MRIMGVMRGITGARGTRLLGALGVLAEPPFARYFAAQTISSAGSYASGIALSFGVLEASGPTSLGLIFLAREIPIVVLVLVGGVFADRWPRRLVLANSSFVQAASQLAGALILIQGATAGGAGAPAGGLVAGHTAALAACAAVNGAATAFSRPATSGLVPQIVSADRLQQANGLLGLTPRLIGIAGAALGAWLIEAVGAGYALALDSASFLVAGLLMRTLARSATRAPRGTSPLADLGEGWREVRSRTWLWAMILSFGAFQIAYFPALTVLGPEIARRSLGGAPAWALVVTGELVGGIVGGVIAVRTRSSRPLVLMCVVGMPIAVQLTALAFAWPLAVIAASAAVGGAGLAMSDAVWFTTLQRLIPDAALSRVSSFDWLGSMALNPLGYALIGPLAALVGTHATMGGAAVLLWVAALAPLAVPAVLNLRLPPADPEVT